MDYQLDDSHPKYIHKEFANKSAFLVSNQMHKALVNVYISLSTSLPFTYKVSTEQIEVEKFLTGTD